MEKNAMFQVKFTKFISISVLINLLNYFLSFYDNLKVEFDNETAAQLSLLENVIQARKTMFEFFFFFIPQSLLFITSTW